MEQVKIGGLVTQALELPPNEADSTLPQVLSAQLSTSDGIRGFFVSYLTLDASPTPPPPLLASTISNLSGSTEHIIDLSLMNVIMPASQSFHFKREAANEKEAATEEEVAMEGSNESMARTSALTCARGKEIMKLLLKLGVEDNERWGRASSEIDNIVAAARSDDSEPVAPGVQRWKDFFVKWGYDKEQTAYIVSQLEQLL